MQCFISISAGHTKKRIYLIFLVFFARWTETVFINTVYIDVSVQTIDWFLNDTGHEYPNRTYQHKKYSTLQIYSSHDLSMNCISGWCTECSSILSHVCQSFELVDYVGKASHSLRSDSSWHVQTHNATRYSGCYVPSCPYKSAATSFFFTSNILFHSLCILLGNISFCQELHL